MFLNSITNRVLYPVEHSTLFSVDILLPGGEINLNGTILDPVACLLDMGFQIGWDLAVPIMEGG